MTDPTPGFTTPSGQTIAREKLIAYLNTATYASPSWSALGMRVEDSSMEFDWGDETKRDILGNVHSSASTPIITQSFDPLNLDSGDSAAVKVWELAVKAHNVQALCSMDVMIAHFYYAPNTSSPASVWAERYPSSMVKPTGLGGPGGGNIEMPIDITYGGEREIGTASVNASTGAVSFSAAA